MKPYQKGTMNVGFILQCNSTLIQSIRNINYLVTLSGNFSCYITRNEGTTSTESCSFDEVYSTYVHYDWGDNSNIVSNVIKLSKVQSVLKSCLSRARENAHVYADWNDKII